MDKDVVVGLELRRANAFLLPAVGDVDCDIHAVVVDDDAKKSNKVAIVFFIVVTEILLRRCCLGCAAFFLEESFLVSRSIF